MKNHDLRPDSIEGLDTPVANDKATLAGGCFWCTEAVFLALVGVVQVRSGYIGGSSTNPTYQEICTGESGHAEAVEIVFDNTKITYKDLLQVFFLTHNPTTLNRQGNDLGSQYRSEIFCHNENQEEEARSYINSLTQLGTFSQPIVTKVTKAPVFYPAEDYHQNYYERNQSQGYCQFVIAPKMAKLKGLYPSKLKIEEL